MDGFKKYIDNFEIYLASIVFAVMLFVIIVQVITRVAGFPIPWAEEAARYLMIWGCCLGVAAGVKSRSHVSIDSIVDHLPFKASITVRIIMDLIEEAVLIFLFFYACKFMYMAFSSGQLMPAIQKPIWIVYLAFPVSFGLAIVRQLFCIIEAVRDPEGRCGIEKKEGEAS